MDKKDYYMYNPLVSVIIPNYCHAKYLDQRIQSVLGQTYQNFEVIILDDASPDNGASKAVIEKYRSNPHVSHIIYNDDNSGSTFKQWNKGFELAKGKLIWIAESDDYCELNFLETLIPCWEQHPDCSIVQCSSFYAFEDKNTPCLNYNPHKGTEYINGYEYIKRYMVNSCYYIPNASAVTFKKDLISSIPKNYISYKSAGDKLFWIYLLERGNICHVNKALNYYRQHNNKVSPQKELDGTQCRENFKISKYLHSKGYVKGINCINEYRFYRYIILCGNYDSEDTRKQLLKLWFPWWKRNKYYAKLIEMLFYKQIGGKHPSPFQNRQ